MKAIVNTDLQFNFGGAGIDTNTWYELSSWFLGEKYALEAKASGKGLYMTKIDNYLADSMAWKFVPYGGGWYYLQNKWFGDTLAVESRHNYQGAGLVKKGVYSGQLWQARNLGNGYYQLYSQFTGAGYGLESNHPVTGNKTQQFGYPGPMMTGWGNVTGQHWKLTPVGVRLPSSLTAGQFLTPGQQLVSTNGAFRLIYQNDGNLVIYDANNHPTWATGTNGKAAGKAIMQLSDGHFVLYTPQNHPIWATGVYNPKYSGSKLIMQDDGNLVVYDTNNKAIWSSNSKRAVPAGSKIPNVAVHSGNKNTVATGPSTSPIQGYGSCGTAGEALTSLCGAVLAGASVCGIVGSGAGMCGMVAGGISSCGLVAGGLSATGVDAALVGFCGAVATAASACVGVASVGGVCGAVLGGAGTCAGVVSGIGVSGASADMGSICGLVAEGANACAGDLEGVGACMADANAGATGIGACLAQVGVCGLVACIALPVGGNW